MVVRSGGVSSPLWLHVGYAGTTRRHSSKCESQTFTVSSPSKTKLKFYCESSLDPSGGLRGSASVGLGLYNFTYPMLKKCPEF